MRAGGRQKRRSEHAGAAHWITGERIEDPEVKRGTSLVQVGRGEGRRRERAEVNTERLGACATRWGRSSPSVQERRSEKVEAPKQEGQVEHEEGKAGSGLPISSWFHGVEEAWAFRVPEFSRQPADVEWSRP